MGRDHDRTPGRWPYRPATATGPRGCDKGLRGTRHNDRRRRSGARGTARPATTLPHPTEHPARPGTAPAPAPAAATTHPSLSTYPDQNPRPSQSDNVPRRMHESNVRGVPPDHGLASRCLTSRPILRVGGLTRERHRVLEAAAPGSSPCGGLHGGMTTPETAADCPVGSWTYCRAWTSPRSSPSVWHRLPGAADNNHPAHHRSWTPPNKTRVRAMGLTRPGDRRSPSRPDS